MHEWVDQTLLYLVDGRWYFTAFISMSWNWHNTCVSKDKHWQYSIPTAKSTPDTQPKLVTTSFQHVSAQIDSNVIVQNTRCGVTLHPLTRFAWDILKCRLFFSYRAELSLSTVRSFIIQTKLCNPKFLFGHHEMVKIQILNQKRGTSIASGTLRVIPTLTSVVHGPGRPRSGSGSRTTLARRAF